MMPGNSQTTGGVHSPNSYHYKDQATDFGTALNSQDKLDKWYSYLQNNRGQLGLSEVLNEGDHIHAATMRGVDPNIKRGSVYGASKPAPAATTSGIKPPPNRFQFRRTR